MISVGLTCLVIALPSRKKNADVLSLPLFILYIFLLRGVPMTAIARMIVRTRSQGPTSQTLLRVVALSSSNHFEDRMHTTILSSRVRLEIRMGVVCRGDAAKIVCNRVFFAK